MARSPVSKPYDEDGLWSQADLAIEALVPTDFRCDSVHVLLSVKSAKSTRK